MLAEYQAALHAQNAKLPQDRHRKLPQNWTPDLSAMMQRIRDPQRGLISAGHIGKALGKTVEDEKELFALNLYVHNPTYHPDGAKLRTTWARFEEFFKIILA